MTIAADREEWLDARRALLEKEKAYARAGDALAAERRALPRLKVEDYAFVGSEGRVQLSDLFADKTQLIVQHIMMGPEWEEACPICSFWADGYEPMAIHMAQRDIALAAVSRAPMASIEAYRDRMGWSFPWVSSLDNSFNFDFGVSATDAELEAGEMTYNYAKAAPRGAEHPGTSVFEKDSDGTIYHTYSTYGRGLDRMNAAYAYIDLTPKGRDEAELPFSMAWVKRHDEY